ASSQLLRSRAGGSSVSNGFLARRLEAMAGMFAQYVRRVSRPVIVAVAAGGLLLPVLTGPSAARGPEAIADVAEKVIDAVVNISTSQKVEAKNGPSLQLPPGSPFEEIFEEFNRNRRGDTQNR